MSDLFTTGIRPAIDAYLKAKGEEERNYGNYWSASSAGYCMRKLIFERLGVPPTTEMASSKIRVFEAGHIFHEWMQRITRDAGLSIAQEVELQDEVLMVRGHFDDLVLVPGEANPPAIGHAINQTPAVKRYDNLILYDYKTVNSRAFTWAKKNGGALSHYHKYQLGTYMYMLRTLNNLNVEKVLPSDYSTRYKLRPRPQDSLKTLNEARILKISKDDLRMDEQQLLWTPDLEKEVVGFWTTLNGYWKAQTIPKCTCADYESGFMAREAFNPFFYEDEPCSLAWYDKCKSEGLLNGKATE